jgi:hypothetical protein
MAEATDTTDAAAETSGDSAEPTTEATTETPATGDDAGLGDAGKKALDAMKAERKAAREEAAAAKAERDALQAKLDGREAEFQQEQVKRLADQAALAKYNERIVRSEVKTAAKGVLNDPQDAYKFLDLGSFEVDDDGNVDEGAIASAIAGLVKDKPYLAAQGGRFQGSADGGARNDTTKPAQLTRADMARMSPEQINDAANSGQFDELLGRRK